MPTKHNNLLKLGYSSTKQCCLVEPCTSQMFALNNSNRTEIYTFPLVIKVGPASFLQFGYMSYLCKLNI